MVVIVIILFILLVSNPASNFAAWGSIQTEFRDFCIFWSLDGYKGDTVVIDGRDVSIQEYCLPALGKLAWSSGDKIECENICRLNL